jgi:hypothetical protein
MCFKPEDPSGVTRINADRFPPSRLINGTMDLAMMSPAEWDSELITDLAPERRCLRKA